MPSNFQGTWQYAKHSAKGNGVVKNPAEITIWDGADDNPATVTVTVTDPDPNAPPLDLPVVTKTANDISFQKDTGNMTGYRGRLVILSANTPALLVGSISKGAYTPPDLGDTDIDVFIAVKTG